MSTSCAHINPLSHQGTSQAGRFLKALDPDNVELHGLDTKDWLQFAYDYARLINYYPEDSLDHPNGDWQDFFADNNEVDALLKQFESGEIEPHMTLFISFLQLLKYPQQSLNRLPKRHLDFFYNEILKLRKKPFGSDRVHVIFELAKNAKEKLLEEGTLLKAGKDSNGNPLNYKTITPLVVNSAKIAALRSIYVEEYVNDDGEDMEVLRYAPVVNSADGQGADLEDDLSWSAFGEWPDAVEKGLYAETRWPAAQLGFYVASPLLIMKEGDRTIKLKFNLSAVPDIQESTIEVFVTGEKEWIQLPSPSLDSEGNFNFILQTEVSAEVDAVLGYNEEVHAAGLNVDHPVVKVIFSQPTDYQKLKASVIDKMQLQVNVSGVKSLQLQNELGNVDPSKPFMPFGPRPKVGSKLSVKYPEINNKPLVDIKLNLEWLNAPADFADHYDQYLDEIGLSSSSSDDVKNHFKFAIDSPYITNGGFKLFGDPPQFSAAFTGSPKQASKAAINMVLAESFYHHLYPELYVNAVLNPTGSNGTVDLPNEPYTPLLDGFTLDYTAVEDIPLAASTGEEFPAMYHVLPFGTQRVVGTDNSIVPRYEDNDLYIGLENMEPGSNVSLLFQVAEGSENPARSSFEENERPQWSALGNDSWIDLNNYFARNETNNFLRSGIVELGLPKEATARNTIINEELHWLRIRLKKQTDAVCKFFDVHTQAAEAIFENRNNATDHLTDGLPAETIGKLVHPRAKIKSVAQPRASFGGKPAEDDAPFYRRTSERMRHKNRAVCIWDYEHLVLEQFPSLYRVKCLNHAHFDISTSKLDELHPGSVTLVLIPKLTDNKEYRLKPMVSSDFIDRVETFINQYTSAHVAIKAVNPVYEPVKFNFDIRFHQGLDGNFCKTRTVEDLKQLLAPWVFETEESIRFGTTFTEYQIVNYLENLEYIDYVTDFKMYHRPTNGSLVKVNTVTPSNSLAILVPHPGQENEIDVIEKTICTYE